MQSKTNEVKHDIVIADFCMTGLCYGAFYHFYGSSGPKTTFITLLHLNAAP